MSDNKRITGNPENEGNPFFSIIMPVYNAGEYLEQSIQSILAQDFTDWELIIADDHSTDGSMAVAERYSRDDPRIRIYGSVKNSGSAYAPRLRAAGLASGEYLVTIDADDLVSPDLLSSHYRCITSYGADLVIPEMWRMKGNDIRKILPSENIDTTKVWTGKDLTRHTLVDWEIPLAGFSVRRGIYMDADRHITLEDLTSIFADELHSRRMLSECGTVFLDRSRYYYRQHEGSVTHNDPQRYVDSRLQTCDNLISMTVETFGENSPTHIRAIENKLYTAVGLLRMINRSGFGRQRKKDLVRRIASAMENTDISMLKGKTSPRYLALMRLPVPVAGIALKIIDPIINLKNGIRKLI